MSWTFSFCGSFILSGLNIFSFWEGFFFPFFYEFLFWITFLFGFQRFNSSVPHNNFRLLLHLKEDLFPLEHYHPFHRVFRFIYFFGIYIPFARFLLYTFTSFLFPLKTWVFHSFKCGRVLVFHVVHT